MKLVTAVRVLARAFSVPVLLVSLPAVCVSACGGSGEPPADDEGNTGGATGVGGSGLTGGSTGAGGSASGGAGNGAGGGPESGGALGSGGASAGGSPGSGGDEAGGSGGAAPVTCPTSSIGAGDSNQAVSVTGTNRSYILHVPAVYDGSTPAPLIIDFHGLGGSGQQQRSSSPYPAQTDPDGVIMAFPTGANGPSGAAWNVEGCCVDTVDDVAFARALVAQIGELVCIDPQRVYAVGFSMGGGMSHYLACHAADLFAAVAPAAFDLLEENVTDCQPSRPITVVSFRGTSDPIVPYVGGYSAVVSGMPITFLGATATRDKWAELNDCTGSAVDAGNGCTEYTACAGGVSVTLCTKQSGGHEAGDAQIAWPILRATSLH